MSRFDPKAITIALVLSLALDVVGSIFLVAAFGAQITSQMSADEMNAALRAVTQTSEFLLAALVYGTGTTAFGGYLAARLARSHPYFNALAVGVVGIVLGLLMSDDAPAWFEALALALSIPASVAGGHLAPRRNQ